MPGIHLHFSNRLELLADSFANLIHDRPLPPFQQETIIVQSRGMARWLAMETANRLNIWANCNCPFPNSFISSMYRLLLPALPEFSPYVKEHMLWHLIDILPQVLQDPDFAKVAAYLGDGDDLKLYQLASETADLLDQYTLFRPGMLIDWEENKGRPPGDHAWQSTVWCRLVELFQHYPQPTAPHRGRLLQLFEAKILAPSFDSAILPSRFSVFGISSLPPYHLRILAGLAHHVDIHFFIMNPCREYWLDIIADRDIVKITRQEAASQEDLHLSEGNSLLASMGHLGRDFLAMLQEFQAAEYDYFSDPGNLSLLATIQREILFLHDRSVAAPDTIPNKSLAAVRDDSLRFHSCHSPMREVEILHDQLLALFESSTAEDPVEPRDILVMAPEIDDYVPLIKAVFDNGNPLHPRIPYTISDQSVRKGSPYIETFLDILQLPQSRFRSTDVLGILEADAVRSRFAISAADLDLIKHWVRDTRICWGIDQYHKQSLQLPPYRENSWRAGIERLLLGYAMPGNSKTLFENILPFDALEGSDTTLLGNFLNFSDTLFHLTDLLQQSHTLAEWSELLLLTKDRLLRPADQAEADDRALHHVIYWLRELQEQTSFRQKISLGVIRSFLISTLDEHLSSLAGGGGFLAGSVTCCSMLPMRAIPCKFIFLLGMNDGLYPRAGRKRSFDLMVQAPERGDRSKRYDDRYLFLETILSARRRLSISFVGQSIQDGSSRPPSVLVSELMDYIDQSHVTDRAQDEFTAPLSTRLTTKHHLQPFHPHYFFSGSDTGAEKHFSYSVENCEAARTLSSGPAERKTLFSPPLPSPPEKMRQVELNELVRFFSHPARYLLIKMVGIAPLEKIQALDTSEPFALKGLTRHNLANDILANLLKYGDCAALYQIKRAAGELPHGSLGESCFQELLAEVKIFHESLAELLAGRQGKPQSLHVRVGDFTVSGHLDNLAADGLVLYRYGRMKPTDVIRSWLSHLVLNSLADESGCDTGRNTFFAARDNIYKYTPTAENRQVLEQLLTLYWQGLSQPLCFFPGASYAFAQEFHKSGSEPAAWRKALNAWEGNGFGQQAEKDDPYHLLCRSSLTMPNQLFTEQAKTVFMPALAHQEKIK